MSRDFELLQKAEQRSKGAATISRREAFPEISRRAEINEAQPPVQSGTRESDWLKAVAVVRKRWRIAALFAGIVLAAAASVAFWSKPEYQPVGRLEINPPGSETFTMQSTSNSLSEAQYLETQAQNLQTDDLAIGYRGHP